MMEVDTRRTLVLRRTPTRDFKNQQLPSASLFCYYQLVTSKGEMSCWVPSVVISCTWTATSSPKKLVTDKRGLLCCQDNATEAIVKSYGHCAVNFSAGLQRPTYRDTLWHKDTQRRQRTMTELDASEDATRRRKDGTEAGWRQKKSVSKTLLNTEIKEQRKACV